MVKAVGPTAVSEGLRTLFNEPVFSDLTIQCQGQTWKLHRAIVCGRNAFFRACIKHQTVEAQNGLINLPEDDPDVVVFLMRYLYTFDIDLCCHHVAEGRKGKKEFAFLMLTTAEKYGITEVTKYWKDHLLEVALFKSCFEHVDARIDFDADTIADFLTEAFNGDTPVMTEIRQTAVATICRRSDKHVVLKHPVIVQVLREQPVLRKLLMERLKPPPQVLGGSLFGPTPPLQRSTGPQHALSALLLHEPIATVLSQHPDISIELIQNLANPL